MTEILDTVELDKLSSKRPSSDLSEDPDEREEVWKASVRAYTARQHAEIRAEWERYHRDQVERHRRTLEGLIAHHEAQAARLYESEGRIDANTPIRPQV